MNVNDRYAVVSKQGLCDGCPGKGNAIKDSQRLCYKCMYQKAQPIAALRKPNGRGQSGSKRKRSNNQSR